MKENADIHNGLAMAVQAILALTDDPDGLPYYSGPIDGQIDQRTIDAARRMLEQIAPREEQDVPSDFFEEVIPENMVQVFSLKTDGGRKLTEHFRVREFACQDGSDVVLIHPLLPVWAEEIRKINGPFSPNSAYRTVSHNKKIDGATYSKHCWGIAMDIPAAKATPLELYQAAEKIMGDTGGLGLYDWGIHMDCRQTKSRWKE